MFALIIAGGEGARLRPYTDDRPKPMIEIAGRPILDYQVTWLVGQGISDIALLCGYKAEVIKDYFGTGDKWGVRIHYSLEREPLGRGGALRQAYSGLSLQGQPVVALNGDTLFGQALKPVIAFHRRKNAIATVILSPLSSPYGIVRVSRAGAISSFVEKPLLPHWVNSGAYILSPEFFDRLPERGDHETATFPQLAREGKLFGYRSKAYWRPIDTVKDIREAERELGQI
ncbi:MAG TPA: nucleotidyltransferase family protein [Dehalococcoidia bacterium]|nr:nucleotidyltransferase family protein [Dehalococcoidia bacterium]